jgi:hypothetical protein
MCNSSKIKAQSIEVLFNSNQVALIPNMRLEEIFSFCRRYYPDQSIIQIGFN